MSVFITSNVRLDQAGLNSRKSEPTRQVWLNGYNDVLELRVFSSQPDIPVQLTDISALRAYYDAAAKTQNGEVLDLEVRQIAGVQAIVLTMRSVAKPTGFTYVSSLALPFKEGSFVLKIQALETITRDDLTTATDALFPAHGLTRVRAEINRLASSLKLEPALNKQAKFQQKPRGIFGRLRIGKFPFF